MTRQVVPFGASELPPMLRERSTGDVYQIIGSDQVCVGVKGPRRRAIEHREYGPGGEYEGGWLFMDGQWIQAEASPGFGYPLCPEAYLCQCGVERTQARRSLHRAACPVLPARGAHGGLRFACLPDIRMMRGGFQHRSGATWRIAKALRAVGIGSSHPLKDPNPSERDLILSNMFRPPRQPGKVEPTQHHPDDADDVAADARTDWRRFRGQEVQP